MLCQKNMHVNAYFNVIICNAYNVNVRWAPSLWSCMLLCPILKDPTRLPLSRHSEVLLLSRWRHQLPFPYPILTAGLIQVFGRPRHHAGLHLYNPWEYFFKNLLKLCISFSLCSHGFLQRRRAAEGTRAESLSAAPSKLAGFLLLN